MVKAARTTPRPHRLRPLTEPKPVAVKADADARPVAVTLQGRHLRVLQVQDTWRIDEGWWQPQPVSRMYWRVALEDGQLMTLYQNLISSRWYEQKC